MFRLNHADEIPVWTIDFRADETFARKAVTYAKKAAPEKHRNHITGVIVSKSGDRYAISYEVILDANAGIPEAEIAALKPYQNKRIQARN